MKKSIQLIDILIRRLGRFKLALKDRIYGFMTGLFHLPPRIIYFKYTYRCNLKCLHCPYREDLYYASYHRELSLEEIKTIFLHLKQFYKRAGFLPLISIGGGEPFVKEDIANLLIFLNELHYRVEVFSNGRLLNKNLVDILKSLPHIELAISLDGLASAHDAVRNDKGSFAKTVDNLDMLFLGGFPSSRVTINTVINALNCENLVDFVKFLREKHWGVKINFDLLNFVTSEALNRFRSECLEHFKVDHLVCGYSTTDLSRVNVTLLIKQLQEVKAIAQEERMPFSLKPEIQLSEIENYYYHYDDYVVVKHCREFKKSIRLEPDGEIVPCAVRYPLGNLLNNDIGKIFYSLNSDIWRRVLKNNIFSICRRCCYLK